MLRLKVLVADAQFLTREGIKSVILSIFPQALIEESESKPDLIDRLANFRPDCLVTAMDGMDFDSPQELAQIMKAYTGTSVMVLAHALPEEEMMAVLNAGFKNFVMKAVTKLDFIQAFEATLSGRNYLGEEVVNVLIGYRAASSFAMNQEKKLTVTEIEIVRLIATGLTTKEIAHRKSLSFHTIITHRKNIFRKLSINSTSELVMYAVRNGIIDTTEYHI